jgi:hypothetical protein
MLNGFITFHSELQVITALLLISPIHKSVHAKPSRTCSVNSRSLASVSNIGDSSSACAHVVTLRRISHSWTMYVCISVGNEAGPCTATFKDLLCYSWNMAPPLVSLPCRTELSIVWVSGSRPLHTNPLLFSSQADFWQLNITWVTPTVFKIILRHRPRKKHPRFHCCNPTVAAA